MARPNLSRVLNGPIMGMAVGLALLAVEIILAAAAKQASLPLRMASSVVLGPEGVEAESFLRHASVGFLVHLGLSAIFGAIFALVHARLPENAQTHYATQSLLGMAFGLLLYAINFQVISRFLFPWFLDTPQLLQAVLHVVVFGLPLGILHALMARPVQPLMVEPQPV